MRKSINTLVAGFALALALASCGEADEETVIADAAGGIDPVEGMPDRAFMILDGTIVSSTPTSFMLDYGSDTISVEVDDQDGFPEGVALNVGDRVTVTGRIDSDLALDNSLEASSVYVHNLGTTFYAAASDEEEAAVETRLVFEPRNVDVTGRVAQIIGREFILGPSGGNLQVDTSDLPDNPFDEEGRKVEVGDRVYVWGDLILAAAATELRAEGLVTLSPDLRRGVGAPNGPAGNAAGADGSNAASDRNGSASSIG